MDATALSKSLFEETWSETDLVCAARTYLQRSRSLLLERHRAGAGGYEIVSSYTAMVDYLIRRLFEETSRDYSRRYPSLDPRCALVAQGGYGRAELNPQSDIDLLFLYTWKITPYVESIAEKILYTLWDAGLQIGHATRSISESVRLAGKDMKVKTAMFDARYLCGDQALYGDFEKAVEEHLVKKNADRFVRDKLEESRLRHERYGESVYLLEPEIKEGEGGLRDIQTVRWIARAKHGLRDLNALAAQGWIQEKDLADLKTSQDFLWRVRNELHFSTGKHHDQLTFEEQEKISHNLGFKGERTLKGVEVFMRSYYLHASQINRLTSLIIHRMTGPSGGVNGKGPMRGREIRKGVRISRGSLWILEPEVFRSQPGNLIDIFFDVQKYKAEVSQETRELIRDHLHLVDEKFRRSAAANLPFFKILKWRGRVYEALSEMHRCGVLGAFIPEFGRLLCMVLHDLYHIYTVDQHSLHLIMELERLKSGEFGETMPLLTQLAREVEKIEILYLGLLFHDIGKGYGGGHSEIGSRMVRNIARRMRLNVDDTTQLEFLVRHHLLMSHTAFRRDLEDEKTVIDFAQTMKNVSNLKMLYLLTYADIRAVGPNVWNHWKASLVEELYLKTLGVLESLEKGEYQREDRRSRVRRVHARLRRRLSRRYSREELQRFLESMPERYFVTTPEDEMPSHFELMRKFDKQTYLSVVRHFPEREYSEIAICTKDRPGLFARITGVFASMGLAILNARITTLKDGLILDVFRVSHGGRAEVVMGSYKWTKLHTVMEGVLGGSVDVAQLVEKSGRPSIFRKRGPKVPTVIQVDNAASDDFTVVEVYTQDRIGVLFTITYAMHRSGISIHLAKISTNVDQVADVFYVTDGRGKKIEDKEQLERLRQILYQEVVPEDEREAQSAH
jgi:[protein-PII] uridylyltransferase